jgi:DNA-binding IclR family transcriptional regulator
MAEPILEKLARRTGATAALGLIADKNVFVAAKHEADRPIVMTMRVGHRFPISCGCHGKAIAALLPDAELKDMLKERDLYFYDKPERFDEDKLIADLKRCREEWFAEDTEEMAPGLNAVEAAVAGVKPLTMNDYKVKITTVPAKRAILV